MQPQEEPSCYTLVYSCPPEFARIFFIIRPNEFDIYYFQKNSPTIFYQFRPQFNHSLHVIFILSNIDKFYIFALSSPKPNQIFSPKAMQVWIRC